MIFRTLLDRLHLSIGQRVCGGFAVVLTLAAVLAIVSAQNVRVLGRSFSFRAGESIHTECSYKYSLDRFTALARGSGWTPLKSWTDAAGMFSVHALVASD